MLTVKKSTAFYRHLLRQAWQITWRRKWLWIFGLFASVISTGGVAEAAFRSFRRIEGGRDLMINLLQGSLVGYETLGQYFHQMYLLGPGRITLTAVLIFIFSLLLLWLVIRSQGVLIYGIADKKKLTLSSMWKNSWSSFWSILSLDIILKLAHLVLIILSTLPLVLFLTRRGLFD